MKSLFQPKPGAITTIALDPNPNTTPAEFEDWLNQVRARFSSVGMNLDRWQSVFAYDYQLAFWAGCDPETAFETANRHYWAEQMKARPDLAQYYHQA